MRVEPLTETTLQLVSAIFSRDQVPEVVQLLQNECGQNLPFLADYSPEQLERFQFAALKLSEGEVPKLLTAIAVAKNDWRDLLVAAGFGHSLRAHQLWAEELLAKP